MTPAEAVKSYFLLNTANTTEENKNLAKTTCVILDYKHEKDTIVKILVIQVETKEAVRWNY